jgi:hypothetical protein
MYGVSLVGKNLSASKEKKAKEREKRQRQRPSSLGVEDAIPPNMNIKKSTNRFQWRLPI